MKARLLTLLSLIVALPLMAEGGLDAAQIRATALIAPAPATDRARAVAALQSAPMMFIENVGQFDARARFQVHSGSGALWLAEDALWFTVLERPGPDLRGLQDLGGLTAEARPRRGVNLKLSFVGANPHPRLEPFNRLETHVSYFIGNGPANWHADVPVWGGVRYADLYSGIDLELSGTKDLAGLGDLRGLRLIARPGADLSAVRLRVEGADEMTLEGDHLRLTTAVGPVSLPPMLTQDGALLSPTMMDDAIAFAPHPFNPLPESVDSPSDSPVDLVYSTFLGGSGYDHGSSIYVDGSGAAYITGATTSSNFPTTPGAFQITYGGGIFDTFVTKLNVAGSGLGYSTFLGGSSTDEGNGITVDASGTVYITGYTESSDFPTTVGAFQTTCGGCPDYPDTFVTKLNADGSGLAYSTFLGGSGRDWGNGIMLDTTGVAYIAGVTASTDFPTTLGAFQTTYAGNWDTYVTELNASGSGLVYSTFLGGSDHECYNGLTGTVNCTIAVDTSGAVYVAGITQSSNFPTTLGAYQTTCNSCPSYDDAFVTKLNPAGNGQQDLVYSTFLGGSSFECDQVGLCAIAVDMSGAAYMTGWTLSSNFPTTPGAFQTTLGGGGDAFVAKLNTAGSALEYSTFLGGSSNDSGSGIALDASGAAYITGYSWSSNYPTTPSAFQSACGSCPAYADAFMTKLNAAGSRLMYSTFLGGSATDWGLSIAVDASGATYLTGLTLSPNFPTTSGAFQTTYGGGYDDAFVAKLVPTMRVYLPLILNNP